MDIRSEFHEPLALTEDFAGPLIFQRTSRSLGLSASFSLASSFSLRLSLLLLLFSFSLFSLSFAPFCVSGLSQPTVGYGVPKWSLTRRINLTPLFNWMILCDPTSPVVHCSLVVNNKLQSLPSIILSLLNWDIPVVTHNVTS